MTRYVLPLGSDRAFIDRRNIGASSSRSTNRAEKKPLRNSGNRPA